MSGLRNRHTRSGFEHVVVLAHNHLPWFIARRLVRVIDFGDGTFSVGWRWRTNSWLVS